MSTTTVDLQGRAQRLANHLLRARRADRAAILLAVYRSEFARAEAERELVKRLRKDDEEIVRLRVRRGGPMVDLPAYLHEHRSNGRPVFFIYDLGQGGEAALQALNYRRELLVEDRQRLVMWLPERELAHLARNAPDFWAFRGRTVEFLELPEPPERQRLAKEFTFYEWKGDYSQSREELEAGIRLRRRLLDELPDEPAFNANRAELLYSLGGQLTQLGRHDVALRALTEAEEVAQNTAPHLLSLIANARGNVYNDLQRYEEAIDAYKRAIDLDPEYAAPWNGLGNVYDDLQRYEEATDAYKRAIDLDPDNAIPWNGLGIVHRHLQRYEEAIDAYKRAIDLDPEYAAPWNGLGNVYRNLQRYEEAIDAYQRAIDLDPESAYPWNGLGVVYRHLQRYEEAIDAYKRAIDLDPEYAAPWNGLGNVYDDLQRYEEATDAYERAIELGHNYAWHGLGLTYSLIGQEEDAVAAHRKAVEVAPDDASYRGSLAAALQQLGREEEVEAELERARELAQDESAYNRACLEAIGGNRGEALDLLAVGLEEDPDLRQWARRDPDLRSLHEERRFWELVGRDEADADGADERG